MASTQRYIEDDLKELTERVSVTILPYLQSVQSTIEGVFFEFGTPIELIETMTQLGKTDSGKTKKYPLIFLFVDVDEPKGYVGDYANLSLRLAILNFTSPTFKAKERLEKNFKPIIMPVYYEFLRQLSLDGKAFLGNGEVENLRHTATRRYYWGNAGEGGNTANKLGDFVDGLEIRNLELKYYLNRC